MEVFTGFNLFIFCLYLVQPFFFSFPFSFSGLLLPLCVYALAGWFEGLFQTAEEGDMRYDRKEERKWGSIIITYESFIWATMFFWFEIKKALVANMG